jgi:hypothetical protein
MGFTHSHRFYHGWFLSQHFERYTLPGHSTETAQKSVGTNSPDFVPFEREKQNIINNMSLANINASSK